MWETISCSRSFIYFVTLEIAWYFLHINMKTMLAILKILEILLILSPAWIDLRSTVNTPSIENKNYRWGHDPL